MEELERIRNIIVSRLKKINAQITEETIKNATQEELEEYLELVDDIIPKLAKIEEILEENKN